VLLLCVRLGVLCLVLSGISLLWLIGVFLCLGWVFFGVVFDMRLCF